MELRIEGRERYQEEPMIIALYIAAAVIMAAGSLYWAWRSRDFRKFLAGAFFVSSGILFYLYLADVSVRLLGTGFVESPGLSAAARSSISYSSCSAFISASSAAALGFALVENGWRVLFTRTTDLVQRLQIARRELALE